jgi:hypothetical protein
MQTGKSVIHDGTSKVGLFGITAMIVTAFLGPLVLPHVSHPSMLYHSILHLASINIAVFPSIVSLLAYSRGGSVKMALMMLGFMSLVGVELFDLLSASGLPVPVFIPAVNIEISHIILLVMLSLFGLGVLTVKKDHEDVLQK